MNKFKISRDNTLILIIDVQDRLASIMKYKDKLVKNANILLETSRLMDLPVVVTEQYPKGLGSTLKELDLSNTNHKVFEKIKYSAYVDDIKDHIDKLKPRNIVVLGMETHICVFQTARDLVNEGYNVLLPIDGVCSRTKENYRNGLDLIRSLGGVVSNTETIAFDLLETAGTEEFKVISKLIK